MKTCKYILFCLFLLYLAPAKAVEEPEDDGRYVTISGIVKDKSEKPCRMPACPSPEESLEKAVSRLRKMY